jgi:ERCC4-type nuclease
MSKIIVDTRESYWVKKKLMKLGTKVIERTISPADYVFSERCAVERKEFKDFLSSIYDGRLFEQTQRLSAVYENAYLVVEGAVAQGLNEIPNPLVFWGALAKVVSERNISIIFTLNENHTAMFLHSLAKKLQEKNKKKIVVQSLPNIGSMRAENLLKRFRSVRNVFTASDKDLRSIEGLGKKTVSKIKEFLDTKYPGLEM